MLLIASYLFYSAWDPRFIALLFFSTTIDYFIALRLDKEEDTRKRKLYLLVSCIVNLTVLGFFKYFNFFIENLEALVNSMGANAEMLRLDLVLPVGISFYTFQTIGYTADIYQRKIKPEKDFLDYALFVSFFPQLVAGPIERASQLIPQLTKKRVVTVQCIRVGLWLILLGYFKKVVVADNIAFSIDRILGGEEPPSGTTVLFCMYGFAVQAYCDFSGYSDIARGLAKLMGVDIVLNFNLPLIARNPSDFWRRWHISLSFWLRDYVYIPMGGNRCHFLRANFNIIFVFLLSGLWHGPTWMWVLWGFYCGILTVIFRTWVAILKLPTLPGKVGDIITRIFYFHVTCIGFLLIRAQEIQVWLTLLKQMIFDFTVEYEVGNIMFPVLFFGGFLAIIECIVKNADDPINSPGWRQGVGIILVSLMILGLVALSPPAGEAFIYFQF